MKKQILVMFFLAFVIAKGFSQQIGDGFSSIVPDLSAALGSGTYNVVNPISSELQNDWYHAFVSRHPNHTNNYQLQITSSIYANDKMYFRKIASGTLEAVNSKWNEIATRGTNIFTGNQSIVGSLVIGNSATATSDSKFDVTGGGITTSLDNINSTLTQRINTANPVISIGIGYLNSDTPFIQSFNSAILSSNSLNLNPFGGNVGIGTANPKNKLDVKGIIHSQEVKVDMSDWSDFVFRKEYNLPTLGEVEKHIVEKGHLENIPSEKEVLKNGINLGEMNAKLLQKIEELTLYMIEQEKRTENLKMIISEQNKRLEKLENKL